MVLRMICPESQAQEKDKASLVKQNPFVERAGLVGEKLVILDDH